MQGVYYLGTAVRSSHRYSTERVGGRHRPAATAQASAPHTVVGKVARAPLHLQERGISAAVASRGDPSRMHLGCLSLGQVREWPVWVLEWLLRAGSVIVSGDPSRLFCCLEFENTIEFAWLACAPGEACAITTHTPATLTTVLDGSCQTPMLSGVALVLPSTMSDID